MSEPMVHYESEVLHELSGFGLVPRPWTPPALVRTYLNELYKWELRQLRDQVRRGELAKSLLSSRVVVLRGRYTLLSRPLETWTVPAAPPHE
ncbi:MAG: hypothetical protein AB7I50_00785 [Vicinamibacterales bacterium]